MKKMKLGFAPTRRRARYPAATPRHIHGVQPADMGPERSRFAFRSRRVRGMFS